VRRPRSSAPGRDGVHPGRVNASLRIGIFTASRLREALVEHIAAGPASFRGEHVFYETTDEALRALTAIPGV
jgi:hypothetical protein